MQRLEVSGAVRLIYGSLGVKGLINNAAYISYAMSKDMSTHYARYITDNLFLTDTTYVKLYLEVVVQPSV